MKVVDELQREVQERQAPDDRQSRPWKGGEAPISSFEGDASWKLRSIYQGSTKNLWEELAGVFLFISRWLLL